MVWPAASAARIPSSSAVGAGNCAGSKSPTVRLQISAPLALSARIWAAMRKISDPTTPRARSDNDASVVAASPSLPTRSMRGVSHADRQSGAPARRRRAGYFAGAGTAAAGSQVRWRLQISVGSQAGLHCGMHCPAWQANPGEQIGAQLASEPHRPAAAARARRWDGAGASLRTATVAEMNIPAPSGLIPSLKP